MDTVLIVLIACFFAFGLPIIAMIYYFERVDRHRPLSKANKRDEPIDAAMKIRERVIVRETVMIPCEYCGGLSPQTAVFCPNCGASRKTR